MLEERDVYGALEKVHIKFGYPLDNPEIKQIAFDQLAKKEKVKILQKV